MAFTPISGTAFQYSNNVNDLAVDYYLKLYDAGTTTPYSMATDAGGLTRLAKCKISAEGYPVTNPLDDTTVFIPHVDQNYRAVLYRNETDADANNTANAAWNIDDLLPDATVAADISQITTRGTTLQSQDDYDRSPLFVDGTDFTAGLGPHIITVPVQVPAWTPNSVGFRFYKLSSSGAIVTPTIASSDASTFTVSDTLLSSDTLFIGDENFRNQMDGDPTDIKARLGLSAIPDVTGFTQSTVYFIDEDGSSRSSVFDLTVVPVSTWESVGPTGSGADNIWTALDNLPTTAKFIEVFIEYRSNGAFANPTFSAFGRKTGTSVSTANSKIANAGLISGATSPSFFGMGYSKIPIDSSGRFDYQQVYSSLPLTTDIYLKGFGV